MTHVVQTLLTIRGFSEATVSKIQAAAAKVDKSGSAGMFQTGLQCRVARQKVIKVNHTVHTANAYYIVRHRLGALLRHPTSLRPTNYLVSEIGTTDRRVAYICERAAQLPASNPFSAASTELSVPRRKRNTALSALFGRSKVSLCRDAIVEG